MTDAHTNIVMSSWNAVEFTKNAIERISEATHTPYYLTVVDNASEDGTQEFLKQFKPAIRCIGYKAIFNTMNVGPGGAYEQGYLVSQELGTEYTLLTNNDVHVQQNWLSILEKTMQDNSDIGILGTLQPVTSMKHPYVSRLSAKDVLQSSSLNLTIEDELRYFFDGRSFDDGARDSVRINKGGVRLLDAPPDAVPTSCAMVSNQAVERIGHIADPRYETYGSEDIDLSWELGRLGLNCAIQNDVYVHHFRHRSSSRSGLDIKAHLKINNIKFVEKWYEVIAGMMNDPNNRAQFESNAKSDRFTKLRHINQNVGFYKDGNMVAKEDLLKS